MPKKIFHGFRARVFGLISVLIIAMSLFFTAVVIYQQTRLLKQNLVHKGLSIIRNLAHNSELGVFTENHDLLESVLQNSVKLESDIAYTVLYNLHGKPLDVHTNEKTFAPHIAENIKKEIFEKRAPFWQKTMLDKDAIYEFWAPVLASEEFKKEEDIVIGFDVKEPSIPELKPFRTGKKGKIIGVAQMGFYLKEINSHIKDIILVNVSITILSLLIGFIFIYIVANRITEPLLRLKQAVETIEKGRAFERIDIDSRDEIGDLAGSFNRMVDSLTKKDKEIMRHVEELSALNLVASAVNQSLDLKNILYTALKEIIKVTGMEAGCIYLPSEDGKTFNIAAYVGIDHKLVNAIDSIKMGEGITGRVAISGESIIVEDISNDPRIARTAVFEEGFKAFASILLRSKEGAIGIMNITSRSVHPFTQDEIKLLYSIGNQIGTAIENSMLYEKVKTQLEEIERTQEKLIRTARLASLGELAANVAHEVNNPLTAVLSYTCMILDDMPDTHPDKKKLNIIQNETLRIKHIVRNLLDFSRQAEPNMDNASIADVIKDTLNLVAHLAKVSNVRIIEEYTDDLPLVTIDVQQMKQVFLNLFNNAMYAMQNGGDLRIEVSKKEKWVCVNVCDTGAGIPENIIHKIFDPFFTIKPETKGTGLGLSISHGIIEKHNGSINITSEIGKGSVFTVMLPVVER